MEVKDQAVWALGNIGGDDNRFKIQLIKAGAIKPILKAITSEANASKSFIRNVCWCLANLIRGRPQPPADELLETIPFLCQVIMNLDDLEILVDACWAISYVSDSGNSTIPYILEQGCITKFIEHLV